MKGATLFLREDVKTGEYMFRRVQIVESHVSLRRKDKGAVVKS